jgi:isoleucyl-tRNA synthetase
MAKARLLAYEKELGSHEILWTKKGKELKGIGYLPLWDWQTAKKAHYVVVDSYVTTEDGTGIVHLALYGEDDYRIIRREGMPIVQNVDENGYCSEAAGQFAGRYFKEADLDIDILKDLHARGQLLGKEKHEHAYPYCYRCDAALMYFARPGWFIRTASYRDEMLRANTYINWQPDYIKDGRFGNWLENTIDWNVTRERYWGSPFPVWTCDKPGCEGELCVGSLDELRSAANCDVDEILFNEKVGYVDLHKPLIDRVTIPCPECTANMTREDFVLDSWFNAGLMFIGQWGYPSTPGSKEVFAKQYPADFICEAIDQTRGWFYTLVATSTLFSLSNDIPEKDWSCYKNVICTELVLDESGQKMSKSRGNVINPMDLFKKFGGDATRWTFYTTNPWNVRRFSEEQVRECVRDLLLPIWNAYSFFATYAGVDKWQPSHDDKPSDHPLDKWLLGELTRLHRDVTSALEKYDVAPAANACVKFLDQLTNWYIRRSRRRFWKSEDDQDKQNAYTTLYCALVDFTYILAPFTPFISEEIYQNLVRTVSTDTPESVHLASWPEKVLDEIDEDLAIWMDLCRKIVRAGRDLRQQHSIKVRQPLSEIKVVVRPEYGSGLRTLQDLILDELNVKELQLLSNDNELVQLQAKPDFKKLGPKFGKEVNKAAEVIRSLSENIVKSLEAGDTVEADGFKIDAEDVQIERAASDKYALSDSEGITIALNLELTPELQNEGRARELVHQIQNQRKEAGLEVTDRIEIKYQADAELDGAVNAHLDWIKSEILATEFESAAKSDLNGAVTKKIDGYEIDLSLDKAKGT